MGDGGDEKQTYLSADMACRLAAIDIGSNSVRLLVAEVLRGGAYRILDEEREPTRLGRSVGAEAVLDDCVARTRRFQQPDGSFSVQLFERPATSPDVFATLSATGHVFEVLALVLDDESLAEPWVTRAAERLVTLLERTSDVDAECGGLYHAVHGLAIYRRRICPDTAATQPPRRLLSAVDGR